jgi:acyl-coenzyme A synthetase/AMP-(fatty) acid ligase
VQHPITSEAIVAFVEMQPGSNVQLPLLQRHARGLAAYMRPYHYVMLEAGQMPLNRVAKADYMVLRQRAEKEVETLKAQGRWMPSPE